MYDGKTDVSVDDSSGLGDFKDGYTSGTFRKEVDKGAVDPAKVVEVWRSPLIPNGPIVYRTALGAEFGKKLVDSYNHLAATDPKCMSAIEGGDFKGYQPVKPDFYQAVIDIRKATIGQ
jgi:phosphonate transport system substrate-binding protein